MQEWESPGYEPTLPVSEKSNPLTRHIDRAPARSIVRMLQACDTQMFQEETGGAYQRLLSEQVVKTVMEVAKRVEVILRDPQDSLVVLSGCGTSGRLAFLAASGFNRALKKLKHTLIYTYIIAGALFSSEEAPEDEATLGTLSLNKAPFVAGQPHLCLQHTHVYTPVLVGFNPTHHAKSESIPGCTFTFHSVVQRMQELAQTHEAFVINPAVAPEAVSGSSRMKGGSATKILLDVVLSAAHAAVFTDSSITHDGIVQRINAYKKAVEVTYAHSDGITALLEAAGQSLQCGRCVCYLGWGSVAVLGLIDATECEPTFGADHKDVRSFISGGYSQLDNSEGHMSSLGRQFNITHEDFLRDVLPHLNNLDTVLLLYTHCDDVSDVVEVTRRVREKTSNIHAVYHHHHRHHHHHHHH